MVSNSAPTRRFNPVKSLSYSDIDEADEQLGQTESDVELNDETVATPLPQAKRLPARESFDFDGWDGGF